MTSPRQHIEAIIAGCPMPPHSANVLRELFDVVDGLVEQGERQRQAMQQATSAIKRAFVCFNEGRSHMAMGKLDDAVGLLEAKP